MPRYEQPPKGFSGGAVINFGGDHCDHTENPGRDQRGHPFNPGHRWNSTGETARAAAIAVSASAKTLEALCLDALADRPRTPEEARAWIEAQTGRAILLTSIRPRFSQLKARGLVTDAGERGLGEGGRCKSIRWRLTTPTERALFSARQAAEAEHGSDAQ